MQIVELGLFIACSLRARGIPAKERQLLIQSKISQEFQSAYFFPDLHISTTKFTAIVFNPYSVLLLLNQQEGVLLSWT